MSFKVPCNFKEQPNALYFSTVEKKLSVKNQFFFLLYMLAVLWSLCWGSLARYRYSFPFSLNCKIDRSGVHVLVYAISCIYFISGTVIMMSLRNSKNTCWAQILDSFRCVSSLFPYRPEYRTLVSLCLGRMTWTMKRWLKDDAGHMICTKNSCRQLKTRSGPPYWNDWRSRKKRKRCWDELRESKSYYYF